MRISSKKNYAFYKGKSQEIWLLFGKKKKKSQGRPGATVVECLTRFQLR